MRKKNPPRLIGQVPPQEVVALRDALKSDNRRQLEAIEAARAVDRAGVPNDDDPRRQR